MTLRTHRLYWILLLSLILAAGPGIARTVAQGTVSGRSGITTANPHAALPETITAPKQRKIAWGLHIQADDETPEPTDEAETPAADDTAVSSDAATTFEDYLGQTDSLESAFGPEEGTLEHDPEAVSFVQAGVDLPNFIAHAEFTNPYDVDEGNWDIGFLFRLGSDDPHLRLVVVSTGDWVLTPASEDPIQQGTVENLNVGANQRNMIDLVVDGDVGYFGLNGDFVSELDLSSNAQSGDVAVGSAFYEDTFQEGEATGFQDFQIWELPSAESTPEPDETETAEPEESATVEPDETVTEEPEETVTAEPDETETAEPEETVTSEPDETVTPGTGNTYESPTFGYTLTYGDDWEIENEEVDNGVDALRLSNGVSTVDFLGYESDLTPAECIADELDFYESTPEYSGVEVSVDENDNELQGEFDDPVFGESAYLVVSFAYTPEDGDPGDFIAYVECRPLEPGASLLKIVQFVPSGDYNDEIESRTALLEGLSFEGAQPDGTPAPDETATAVPDETETATPEETETAEPEATVTTTAGDTYESPTYGYSLLLTDDWQIDSESSKDGIDSVRLDNGVSTIDLLGYETDFSPVECVDEDIAYYQSEQGFSNAEVMVDENGDEMRGEASGSAFAVVSFTFTDANGDDTDYVAYVECRDLDEPGTQLKIVQYSPPDDFESESESRDNLLNGLEQGGQAAGTPTEESGTPESTGTPDETPESGGGSLTVEIEPADTGGVSGLATIDADAGGSTVRILVSGADDGTVAVIQEGTCDDLSGEAAFQLEPLDGGLSETTLDASIDDLTSTEHALTLHESQDNLDDPLACGEISA